jgi:hypothetical protein
MNKTHLTRVADLVFNENARYGHDKSGGGDHKHKQAMNLL